VGDDYRRAGRGRAGQGAVAGRDLHGEAIAAVAITGGAEVQRRGGLAGEGGAVLEPRTDVAGGGPVGVVAGHVGRQHLIRGRTARRDGDGVDDRRAVLYQDRGAGRGRAGQGAVAGRDPDGEAVAAVAVARLAQVQGGAGLAAEGGAVLEP